MADHVLHMEVHCSTINFKYGSESCTCQPGIQFVKSPTSRKLKVLLVNCLTKTSTHCWKWLPSLYIMFPFFFYRIVHNVSLLRNFRTSAFHPATKPVLKFQSPFEKYFHEPPTLYALDVNVIQYISDLMFFFYFLLIYTVLNSQAGRYKAAVLPLDQRFVGISDLMYTSHKLDLNQVF